MGKGLISIIFVFIIIIITNKLFKRTNYYKNLKYQTQKFIIGVPENLEIVNTGSSYGRFAFDYSNTNLKGFNFALQPQSLSYDFRILKQYTGKLDEGCIVILVIPDLVFGFLDYSQDSANDKYYDFLDKDLIQGYTSFKYVKKRFIPVLKSWKNPIRIFRDVTEVKNDLLDINPMSADEVELDAKKRAYSWIREFNLQNLQDENIHEELEDMFERTTNLLTEMIDYCLDNKFRPVIVVPPTSGILNNLISKPFMQRVLYDNISLANKQNIPVLDYLYDDSFQDESMYINCDMLNRNGRQVFTRTVLDDLHKLGVVEDVYDEEDKGSIQA